MPQATCGSRLATAGIGKFAPPTEIPCELDPETMGHVLPCLKFFVGEVAARRYVCAAVSALSPKDASGCWVR